MNRFEGLNLVDLLALLNEIVPPEPVSLMPQTAGWWILGGWLLASIACCVAAVRRSRRRNRYRREALAELQHIAARMDEPQATADISALLKRTALAAYPRREVASLYGSDWGGFLVDSSNNDEVVKVAAYEIARAPYQDDIDTICFVRAAERWIKHHRV